MMAKRGLCFDLDGTLIDSGQGGLIHLFKVAKTLNLPINEEIEAKIRNLWGQHPHNILKASWPNFEDISKFFEKWEEIDIAEPFPVFPGTKEALEKLSGKFYFSILTSRNFKTAIVQLRQNKLLQFFDLIVTADSSPYKKPDPRSIVPIFHRYKSFGVNLKQIIFVGDTVEGDWKLAQAICIEFFAVTSGGMDTREKFLTAEVPEDHIIDSVADLPRILLT